MIKEKAIGRPDGQTSKSLSFLCSVEDDTKVVFDQNDFTDYTWASLEELRGLEHVGIEAEFIKTEAIIASGQKLEPFFADTDKVDFRPTEKIT